MRGDRVALAVALVALASFAQAQPLKIVEVNAPAVNCVFHANCIIPVTDSTGNILLPTLDPGTAWLQSRTFSGDPGTPGAGTTGFLYRVSLTQASGYSDCIVGFNLNFGPLKQLPYANNTLADIFVITSGGLGTVGLASATRFNDVIIFELAKPLCSAGPPDVSKTTYFFGMAATASIMQVNAQVQVIGPTPIYAVDARVPTHVVPSDPPGGL